MAATYDPNSLNIAKPIAITTPNKNVLSYFMKNDVSYYVDENYRIQNYRNEEPIVHIIVANNYIIIENSSNEHKLEDFFYLTSFNKEKFQSLEVALGDLCNKISKILKELKIEPKLSFISLICHDLLTRTEILGICNVFINHLGFKGILFTPYSLSQAIGMGYSNCTIINIYEDYSTVGFVEDYWLSDIFSFSSVKCNGFNYVDSEDFVDEFNRFKTFDEKNMFKCNICEFKDDLESKIETHILNSHIKESKCHKEMSPEKHVKEHIKKYDNSNENIYSAITNRLCYIYTQEKMKRISNNIIVFNHGEFSFDEGALKEAFKIHEIEPNVTLFEEDVSNMILAGMATFSELECSKDMWMTDKEWNSVGLRIFKEKVLFII